MLIMSRRFTVPFYRQFPLYRLSSLSYLFLELRILATFLGKIAPNEIPDKNKKKPVAK